MDRMKEEGGVTQSGGGEIESVRAKLGKGTRSESHGEVRRG